MTTKKTAKGKYLDPKNDLTFCKIFGQHPHLLISFLNSMLPLAEEQLIESIIDENTEEIPEDLQSDKLISEALECVQKEAFTDEELEYYNQYWDAISTEKAALEEMKKQLEEECRQKEEAKIREKEAKIREKEAKAREEATKTEMAKKSEHKNNTYSNCTYSKILQ